MGPKRQPGTGGVAPAGTKILPAFGFQDFIAFSCPGSILRERGTTQRHTGASFTDMAAGPSPPRLPGPSGSLSLRRTALCLTRGRAEAWNRPRNERRAKPQPPGAEGLLRKARPFGASRPSRGDQSPHVPPCPPGGISISAARRAKEIASLRGPPRPRSIFGHFLLIKKVATPASGFCLTISQTTVLPMAQAKNIPAVQPEQR